MIDYDEAVRLERLYKSTWLCSECGRRNTMDENCCPRCMDRALEADTAKLAALGHG